MVSLLNHIVLIVSTLFPIVNPLGGAPIFYALTAEATHQQRKTLSRQVAFNSFLLLLGSILIGSHVLAFFGVSIPIVQVGGGLIVISAGWEMLKRQDDGHEGIEHGTDTEQVLSRSFYPLTMPFTVGPGSIATAITLGANAPHTGGERLALGLLAAAVGALIVALGVYLCYAFAERTVKLLGPAALNAVLRLMAFLLLCVGLQIAWNGVRALAHLP